MCSSIALLFFSSGNLLRSEFIVICKYFPRELSVKVQTNSGDPKDVCKVLFYRSDKDFCRNALDLREKLFAHRNVSITVSQFHPFPQVHIHTLDKL